MKSSVPAQTPHTVLSRILADPPRQFRTVLITNAARDAYDVIERATEAGAVTENTRLLALAFPFFPYLLGRIEQGIAEPRRPAYR